MAFNDKVLYKKFFENLIHASMIISQEGYIISANNAAQELTGKKKDELIGKKTCAEIFCGSKTIPSNCPCRSFLKGKKDNKELFYHNKSGYYKINCIPIKASKDNKFHILLVATNITEQKKLERYYKSIFENTGAATVIIEKDKTLSLVNKKFEKLSGFSKKEIEGKKKWTEFVTKKDLDRMKKYHDNRRNKRDAPNTYEFDFKDKNGKIKQVLMTIDLIPGTKITVGSIVDLTDLKMAEEKYRNFFNKSPLLMAEADKEGNILSLNPAMTRILGFSATELKEKNIRNKIKDSVFEVRRKMAKEAIKKNKVISFEDSRKDRFFLNHFIPLVRNNDERILVYAMDITERKKMELSLRESEKSYRELFNNMPDAIFIHDASNYKLIDANDEAINRFKFKKGVLDKLEFSDFSSIAKGFTQKKGLNYLKKAKEGKKQVFEWASKTSNGKLIWHEMNLKSVEIGGKKRVIAIARDITNRKKIEKDLKENENKYHTLFEKASDAILILSNKEIIDCNIRCCKLFDRTKEKIIGKKPCDFCSKIQPSGDDSEKKFKEMLLESIEKNNSFEFTFTKADGNPVYTDVTSSFIDINGKKYTICLLHDITERKKTELQIIKTKSYLKNLINSASEIIIAIDIDKRITTWSKSAEKITGFSEKQVKNKKIKNLKVLKNPENIEKIVTKICNDEPFDSKTIEILTPEGEKKIFDFSSSTILGRDKKCIGALLICTDVTKEYEKTGYLNIGNSYLSINKSTDDLLSYIDRLKDDYKILFITRPKKYLLDKLKNKYNKIVTLLLNDEKISGYQTIDSLEQFREKITNFIKKSSGKKIIILDRVDFFLMKKTFRDFITELYRINSIVLNKKALFILNINSEMFSSDELTLLKREFGSYLNSGLEKIKLDEELYSILVFINKQQDQHSTVTYKKIGKDLSISHSTVSKRLKDLLERDLIHIEKKGRKKQVSLTQKGKLLLKPN